MGKGRDGLKSIIDDKVESLSVINDRLKSIVKKTINHDKELSNIIESQGYNDSPITGNYPSAEDDGIIESFAPGGIVESSMEDGYTDIEDELDEEKLEAMLEEKEDFEYEITEMSFEPEMNDDLDSEIVEMLTTKTEDYYEHQEDLLEQFHEFMENEENIIEGKLTEAEKAANFQKKQERRGTTLGSDGKAGAVIGRMTDSYKRSFQYNKRFIRKMGREIKGLKGNVSKVFLNSLAENRGLIFADMGDVLNAFQLVSGGKNPAKKIQEMIRGYLSSADKLAKSVTGGKLGKETLGKLAFELITEIENNKSAGDRTKINEKDLQSVFKLLKVGGADAMKKQEAEAEADKRELPAYKGSLKTGDDILENFSTETDELKSLMMNIVESIDTMDEEELENILEMKRYNKNNIVNPKDGYVDKRKTDARSESVAKREQEDYVTGFVNKDRTGKRDSEKETGLKVALRKLMSNYGAKTIARIAGGMQSGAYGMGFFVDMQRIAFENGSKLKKSFKGNAISQIESIRQGRTVAAFVTNFMTWLRRLNKAGLFTGKQFTVERNNEDGKRQEKKYTLPTSEEMQKVISNLKDDVITFLHTTARNEFWSGWRKTASRSKKAGKAAGKRVKKQDIFEDIALVTSLL